MADLNRDLDYAVALALGWKRIAWTVSKRGSMPRRWILKPPAWKPLDELTELEIANCEVQEATDGEEPYRDFLRNVPHYSTDDGVAIAALVGFCGKHELSQWAIEGDNESVSCHINGQRIYVGKSIANVICQAIQAAHEAGKEGKHDD